MRAAALLSFLLTASCSGPLPEDAPEANPPPVAHIAGVIGPVVGINHDGVTAILDDGERFQATTIVDMNGTAVMTRLNAPSDALQAGSSHAFTMGDEVSAVGCAGSSPSNWDIVDAPAEVMRVSVGDDAITLTMVLRGQAESVTTTIPLDAPDA